MHAHTYRLPACRHTRPPTVRHCPHAMYTRHSVQHGRTSPLPTARPAEPRAAQHATHSTARVTHPTSLGARVCITAQPSCPQRVHSRCNIQRVYCRRPCSPHCSTHGAALHAHTADRHRHPPPASLSIHRPPQGFSCSGRAHHPITPGTAAPPPSFPAWTTQTTSPTPAQ